MFATEKAIKFEHSKQNILAYQNINSLDARAASTTSSSACNIKQELLIAIKNTTQNIRGFRDDGIIKNKRTTGKQETAKNVNHASIAVDL